MIEVPGALVAETSRREGERGRDWLEALPGLVDRALARWGLTWSGGVMHGAVGVVVPVRRGDGTAAVLKVSFPHPGNVAEPKALAVWAGRGAVRLLENDAEVFAMVLEKVEHRSLADLPDAVERVVVAGRLNRRLAVPAVGEFPSLKGVADEWAREIESRYGRVRTELADRLVGRALESCRELAKEQPNLLVHGDMNFSNILEASREPWLVVDPKGWAGDPAYDAVNLLRDRWHTMPDLAKTLPYQLAAFADAAELDRDRVIRWVQACAVKDTLWSAEHGEQHVRAGVSETVAGIG
ncbi:aminoglycoside phosphotransferase family protein [Kribbella sp. NPDC051620]|uniref:aminoglycoside phosphotransferase family protein n=1 Tax=Kribbella sp. NPDC051620 TaxID=3364120 RepID=UPI00379D3588